MHPDFLPELDVLVAVWEDTMSPMMPLLKVHLHSKVHLP